MALVRVLTATRTGGGYADEYSGGGLLPVTYPELLASPSAELEALARSKGVDEDGIPWLVYTPMYTTGPIGPNDMGIPENTPSDPQWPVYWWKGSRANVKGAWSGAGPFFKVKTEAEAEAMLRRAGVDVSREFATLDIMDVVAGGARDHRMVLYARNGQLWEPLASYPFYKPSSWVSFRDTDLIPLAAVALAIAGGPIVTAIGNALVPSAVAAAYPGLTQAVGTVALNTATNGGDLGAALQSVILSAVGAQAGALAASATGVNALGAATGAAATAALRGGDVKDAVTGSLLSYGVKNMGELWDTFTGWGSDIAEFIGYGGGDAVVAQPSADYFDPVYGEAWSGVVDVPGFDPSGMTPDPLPAPESSGWDFGEVLSNVTAAAMAAIKINQAYQATKAPPRTQIVSGNTVQTPSANGTLTVRNTATGQVSTQRPPVGTPFVLADGRTIINNGDGTYTLIARDGSSQRLPYPTGGAMVPGYGASQGFSLGNIPPAYLAGGALLIGALLLSRARR